VSVRRTKLHVVEVVPDAALLGREAEVRTVISRFFPNVPPLRLYRTTEGAIGCQLDVAVTARDRKRLANAFEAVSKALAGVRA
jgi:hypothetical protein